MFGGEASPWANYFAPLFGAAAVPSTPVAPPAISEGLTSLLVLVAVAIGLVIAWMRYATAAAQREAASRLAVETERMPALLTNLFYFDAAIDLIFVRPAQAAGRLFGQVLDPHVLDGAVRDVVARYALAWNARAILPNRPAPRVRFDLGLWRGVLHRVLRVRGRRTLMALVLVTILLPIAAAALLLLLPRDDETLSRVIGTLVAVVTFATVIAAGTAQWSAHWLSRPFDAAFHFGATPISFWLALLLTVCTASAIASCRIERTRDFVALLLALEGAMLGLFLARDLLVFALFWDLMLVPVFFGLIGWGEHSPTAWRYFIYNFAGGLTLLLATAAFGVIYGSTDVIGSAGAPLAGGWAPWIYAGFAFAFLVKTPVWPLHTWMPPTYSSLPSPMVAVVSAVQSKAGLYGFIAIATRDAARIRARVRRCR